MELNHRPPLYKNGALTTELQPHLISCYNSLDLQTMPEGLSHNASLEPP